MIKQIPISYLLHNNKMRNIELYATLKVLKNNYYNKKVIDNCIRDL